MAFLCQSLTYLNSKLHNRLPEVFARFRRYLYLATVSGLVAVSSHSSPVEIGKRVLHILGEDRKAHSCGETTLVLNKLSDSPDFGLGDRAACAMTMRCQSAHNVVLNVANIRPNAIGMAGSILAKRQ